MGDTEPVGTLAEEAAKLFAAMQTLVGEANTRSTGPEDAAEPDADGSDATSTWQDDLLGAGHSAECRWCLHCHLTRMARATTPEVRDHLSQAVISLAMAVKGLLEEAGPTARESAPLEKIDLTEE